MQPLASASALAHRLFHFPDPLPAAHRSPSPPALHYELANSRQSLERALASYHDAAYLSLIRHAQAPGHHDLERRGLELDRAFLNYRRRLATLSRSRSNSAT